LAASTKLEPVRGLVESGAGRLTLRHVDVTKLGPADAYVEVWITYMISLSAGKLQPLPPVLNSGDFQASGDHLGAPIREFVGRGGDRGIYVVRYWVGPEADSSLLEQTRFIIQHLRLTPGGGGGGN
jgi:hypothetical protein